MVARRLAGAAGFVLALLLIALVPAAASGHAILQESHPERGENLEASPERIEFGFNEPVETSFGAIRLFDAAGEQVAMGEVTHPQGDRATISAELGAELSDGSYTAVYRVVSADSHPVSGGLVFSVGAPGQGGTPISELLGDSGSQPDSPAYVIDRWLGYVATALLVGGLIFLLAVWRPVLAAGRRGGREAASAPFEARMRLLLRVGAVTGLLAAIAALPIQAATAAGVSLLDGFDTDLIGSVLDTRYGTVALLRSIAWAAIAVYVLLVPGAVWRRSRAVAVALVVPAAMLVLAPPLAGHASTQGPTALLVPAATVHVAAMAVWLGGLAALLFVVPRGTRALPVEARPALLADLLGRFSPLALGSVIALALGGLVQAIVEVGSFPPLIEDGFGRAVLAKVVILLLLVALGWHNRSRIIPAIAGVAARGEGALGRVGRRLRGNLRAEVALIAIALIATALLVSYQPSADEAKGPVSGNVVMAGIDDTLLEYTIEPATRGPNAIHVYLFDGEDGTPEEPQEASASIALPDKEIGPLELDLRRSGPGHYTAPSAEFSIAGDWDLTIAVRTSKFDADETTIEVPIN